MFLLSPKKFSDALGLYFKTHKFGNTTLNDFITALDTQFEGPFSLQQWQQDWLVNPGCNQLEPEWKDK